MNNRRNELLLVSAKEYCKCVVEGKTIKYNQKASTNNVSNESYFGMLVNCSNNVVTITGTSTFNGSGDINIYVIFNTFSVVSSHKYISLSSNQKFRLLCFNGAQDFYSFGDEVFAPGYNGDLNVSLQPKDTSYIANGLTLNETITCMIIDLTELGLDSVSSVADFYATDLGKYILNGNYLSATSGAFIQANTPINFKGVNVWNEQMELGSLTNGAEVSSSTELRNVGYIKVIPNTKYYALGGGTIFLSFYDKNKTFIEEGAVNNDYFITPNNCYYLRFRLTDSYGTTYHHDICISKNVWDENWEEGAYDGNGNKDYSTNAIRCASLISVLPSAKYLYLVGTGGYLVISYYDKNKNFISQLSGYGRNESYVTPSNAYYMTFAVVSGYGSTYNNDIAIFYNNYQRYCGTNVLMEGLVLQKGDTYKSWGLDKVSYNNQNSMPNGTITGWNVIASANVVSGHKYLIHNVYSRQSQSQQDTDYQVYIDGILDEYIYNINATQDSIITATQTGTCYFNSATYENYVSGVQYYIAVIDLTLLGLDNVTNVADFHKTPLGMLLAKGYYLPYTTTNKTTKDQLVRTMVDIDLSNLTWTKHSATINRNGYYTCDISSYGIKYYDSTQVANALSDKCLIISEEENSLEGRPLGYLSIYEDTICYNSNDNSAPTGHLLVELATPTLVMWQTLDIENYDEFVTTDPHIYKLNIDLSDYGILDITSDSGNKISNLTMLNIGGSDGDFCYQDGYIYQKTNDIESAWIYQIQISNVPSRMVSRRTINVESDNGVDLDFTKE